MNFIFDIDGVLADNSHRLHLIDRGREGGADWEAYFAGVGDDSPINEGIALLDAVVVRYGWGSVEFWTGRQGDTRTMLSTAVWLGKHCGVSSERMLEKLTMRGMDDRRTNEKLKRAWAEARKRRDGSAASYLIVEDNPKAAEAYRAAGFSVLLFQRGVR